MIISKKYNNTRTFADLYYGDVFEAMDNYYMVVKNTKFDLNNTVNLNTGELCHFDETDNVHIIDYSFTVM